MEVVFWRTFQGRDRRKHAFRTNWEYILLFGAGDRLDHRSMAMAETFVVLKRVLRGPSSNAARFLAKQVNLANVGSRSGSIVRRIGFVETPTPSEIVANYLRGLVLFGRFNPRGNWFWWGWFPERVVITSEAASCPKELRSFVRRGEMEVRYDQDVEAIIHHCAQNRRDWLTPELAKIYLEMHELGLVASVGTYREGRLVGGLWGLSIGRVFSIMSMFHLENRAGALALAALSNRVAQQSRWSIIDCGVRNTHFGRYGAKEISVNQFSALVLENMLDSRNGASGAMPVTDLNRPSTQGEEISPLSSL